MRFIKKKSKELEGNMSLWNKKNWKKIGKKKSIKISFKQEDKCKLDKWMFVIVKIEIANKINVNLRHPNFIKSYSEGVLGNKKRFLFILKTFTNIIQNALPIHF